MILGIDPGSRVTGYGLICSARGPLRAVDWGYIAPPLTAPLAERIGLIAEGIQGLLEKFQPAELAIEAQFIHLNPQSALKLGLVRGAILFAARLCGIQSFEYSPALIKKRCSGCGRASKLQIRHFMASTLQIDSAHLTSDAADALATALCHLRQKEAKKRLQFAPAQLDANLAKKPPQPADFPSDSASRRIDPAEIAASFSPSPLADVIPKAL